MRHVGQNHARLRECREICAFGKRSGFRIMRGDKSQGKEAAVNDGTAAYRLREQLKRFVGIVFPHVPKTQKEFPGQMFFGIQAGQTTVPGRIARALEEDILLKKTEERLSRHLLAEGLDATVQDAVLAQGAACVHDDTIVSIDPSDIQKPYARDGGMPLLAKVWDGSRGRVGDNLGYNLCFATASPGMSRRIVPLHMAMWSAKEEGFTGENDKVLEVMGKIARACEGRGIYVVRQGRGRELALRLLRQGGAGLHRQACRRPPSPALERQAARRRPRRDVRDEVPRPRGVQEPRQGAGGADRVRIDPGPTAGAPRSRASPGRREMAALREADDAADHAARGPVPQKPPAGRRGVSHALARGGDDPLREAGLRDRGRAASQVRPPQGHGRHRPGDGVLRHGVAGPRRQARGACGPRQARLKADVRHAGLLLLRHRGRPQDALLAPWQVERPRRTGQGAGRTVPDDPGAVAATPENTDGRRRRRGQAHPRPLGAGSPRQPFYRLGIVQVGMALTI